MDTLRVPLEDGARTTVYVAAFPLAAVRVRVARLDGSESLVRRCRRTGATHAVVGGIFVRPGNTPLGELRIGGARVETVPFDAPWDGERACLQVEPGALTIARRPDLPAEPSGDLLQSGPLLVRDGASAVTGGDDEGFTAGAHQFDSDISDGRHPRCALAPTAGSLLAVACDGRHRHDAGRGRLVNRPREQHGIELLDGRAIATALVLELRS